MTTTALAADEIGAHAVTLVAGTADTVTIARDCEEVEVVNLNGLGPIYFRVDGTAPVVAGTKSFVVPAAIGAARRVPVSGGGTTVVKLISAAAAQYSVMGSL